MEEEKIENDAASKPLIEVKKTSELLQINTQVPDSNNEAAKPDISGLELLSNSIVEYENCRSKSEVKYEDDNGDVLNGIAHMTIKDKESEMFPKTIDDNLGGLNLLCALAEQRFVEEVLEKRAESDEYKKPEVDDNKTAHVDKADAYADDDAEMDLEREKLIVLKKVTDERELDFDFCAISKKTERLKADCTCDDDKPRKKPDRDWSPSFLSEVERNMAKLADIHRQYTEQMRSECGDCTRKRNRSPSPPLLDKMDNPVRYRTSPELLRPPTLCAVTPTTPKPEKRRSCDSTPEKISSSKKRKVGRPKKLLSAPGLRIATETIVAKKPKSKNGLVSFLLAAKNRLQNGVVDSPPRFVEEKVKVKSKPKVKSISKSKREELKKKKHKISKIRPKLKAEPKMKKEVQEEEECSEWEVSMPVEEEIEVRADNRVENF